MYEHNGLVSPQFSERLSDRPNTGIRFRESTAPKTIQKNVIDDLDNWLICIPQLVSPCQGSLRQFDLQNMLAPCKRKQSCKLWVKPSAPYPQPLTPATGEGARGPGAPVRPNGQPLPSSWMAATSVQTQCGWNWRGKRLQKFWTAIYWASQKFALL